jgi:hypothetical protein
MNSKLIELIETVPAVGAAIFLGTTPRKILQGLRKREASHGLGLQQRLRAVSIDVAGLDTSFSVSVVDKSLEHLTLGPDEAIGLDTGDPKSLKSAEVEGKLYFTEENYYNNPGVAKDGTGTGGVGIKGRAMTVMHRNRIKSLIREILRDAGNYKKQQQIIETSGEKKAPKKSIPLFVVTGFAGGMGPGGVMTVLMITRELEIELGITVKIILLGLVLGSLTTTDTAKAARNQEALCKEFMARLVGHYHDLDQPNYTQLCDSFILMSNINNEGEVYSLDELIMIVVDYIFTFFHTPLGREIQERMVDIEETWSKDESGGQRFVSTASPAKIHFDAPRFLWAIAHELVILFFERLLTDKLWPSVADEALQFAKAHDWIESDTKNQAYEHIRRLSSLGNADAVEYALSELAQRTGRRCGFNRCCDLDSASKYIIDVVVDTRLVPFITKESEKFSVNATKVLHNKVVTQLQEPDGISRSKSFLDAQNTLTAKSCKSDNAKLSLSQNKMKPILNALGSGRDMCKQLESKSWLVRWLSFSTKSEIRRIFTVYTEQGISNKVEIGGRLALANMFYPELQEVLNELLAEIHGIIGNVTTASAKIKGAANQLRNDKPLLKAPLGIDLLTSKMTDEGHKKVVDAEGGQEEVFLKIFHYFKGRYKNLLAFIHHDTGEICDTLLDFCMDMATRHLGQLNVAEVLKNYYTSDNLLKEIIHLRIKESRSRIKTSGETDKEIPTMKFIGVHNRIVGEWITKIANEIDPGWQYFVTGDKYSITFLQQRSQISMVDIMTETGLKYTRPESLEELVQIGADPLTAVMPPANSTEKERQMVIAMGILSSMIKKNDIGFELHGYSKTPIALGHSLTEISRTIFENYHFCGFIFRCFIRDVVIDAPSMFKKIDVIAKNGKADSELVKQMGQQPFMRARHTTRVLTKYLSRLPKAVKDALMKEILND